MEPFIPYFIWAALILAGLGVLTIILFSIRGLIYGKVEAVSIAIMAIPIALFVVLGMMMESWAVAGIWTLLIMFVLAGLALFFSGVRSFFI